MPFPWLAAAAGLPLGLALGRGVHRLIAAWPEGHALWTPSVRRPARRGARGPFWRGAGGTIALVTAGVVGLGLTHPSPDWLGWSQAVLLWVLLYALAAVDLRSLLVDVRLVALGIALRVLVLLIWRREALFDMTVGLLIAAGFFHILGLFYEVLRGRAGLGEGDAAVAGLIGAFVGWQGLLPLAALSALSGLAVGVIWLAAARRPMSTPIPFAPFLCGAGLAVYLGQLHEWPGAWLLFPML